MKSNQKPLTQAEKNKGIISSNFPISKIFQFRKVQTSKGKEECLKGNAN